MNPGEVWEENELWIELSWRIDPDGSARHPPLVRVEGAAGREARPSTSTTATIFEHSVPGLPERAAAEGLTPLAYMRRYGAFEIVAEGRPRSTRSRCPTEELEDVRVDGLGRVYTRAPKPASPNVVPLPTPEPDADGRRPVGVEVDGRIAAGLSDAERPARVLLAHARRVGLGRGGGPDVPAQPRPPGRSSSPGSSFSSPTFRLPVQIHTRSANAKWLDEIAHTNPLWVHPADAARIGVATGDLVRVETEIGHFVVKAWVTEGIRPGRRRLQPSHGPLAARQARSASARRCRR